MSGLIAVDPGVRGCGVSAWIDRRLFKAAYVKNPCDHGQSAAEAARMAYAVEQWVDTFVLDPIVDEVTFELVIECPRVYDATHQKGDQNKSIIPLSLVVGAVASSFQGWPIRQYFPRDWKGTIDPDDAIKMVKTRLSVDERSRVILPAPSLQHNVWDAVGIGLKDLGRFEPTRVFARES